MEKKRLVIISAIILTIIIAIKLLFPTINILGFTIDEQNSEFYENTNISLNGSGTYNWIPKVKGKITSFKISGTLEKEGNAKVYFENFLVLDGEKIKNVKKISFLTGNVVNDTTENNTTTTNTTETNNTSVNETSKETNNEEENTDTQTTQEETQENKTEEQESTKEKITFENSCQTSCLIENLSQKESYTIKLDSKNSTILITKISYKIENQKKTTNSNEKNPKNTQEKEASTKQNSTEINRTEKIKPSKTSKTSKAKEETSSSQNTLKIIFLFLVIIITSLVIIVKERKEKKKKKKKSTPSKIKL